MKLTKEEIENLTNFENLFTYSKLNLVPVKNKGDLVASVSRQPVGTDPAVKGSVTVKAQNDSRESVFAGGLSIGRSMGAGASVVVAVAKNDVKALAHDIHAYQDVNVTADNDDRYLLLNVNLGASLNNAGELGVTVTSLESKANAEVAGKVNADNGAFNLKANNHTDITNVAVALAGSAKNAATPVFVYTGFTGEANARLKAGTVNAQNGVVVSADSNKTVDQYTIGMAASGQVALSGAVSIVKLGDTTNALVTAPVTVKARGMSVFADSGYNMIGATGVIAASGETAVGLNAIATVIKASTLAEMAGKANVRSGGLNVSASANRDVINTALSAGIGGEAGVSVGVMALIAGDKMDQEAADQLMYGTADKKNKVFDIAALLKALRDRGAYTDPMSTMEDDLSGNGQNTDTSKLGHEEGGNRTFDVASGYSDGTDGENQQAAETADVQRARLVGSTAYSDSPKDSVIARIAETADITGGVTVKANQTTVADLYGASVGGGEIGGGVSIAVAKLRSNVLASSTGLIHAEGGNVKVQAVSDSTAARADEAEQARSRALKASLLDKLDPTQRTIRAVGLAVGMGGTGGGVSAAFVRLDNITSAALAGHVEKANDINVDAKAKYDNVLATTVAAGGGACAGLAGSLAIAVTDGTVSATLGRNRNAKNAIANDGVFTVGNKIDVTTDSMLGANAVAVSAAGGAAGIAGGVAIATNNLTQNTAVERGAKLTGTQVYAPGKLNVSATSAPPPTAT